MAVALIENVIAQTVTPAGNPDIPIAGVAGPCYTVNCDMVTCPDVPSEHLRVVAWDDASQGYFKIWDNMGNSSPIIPLNTGEYLPDVVIGCYEIANVIYYEVCVVAIVYNTTTSSYDINFSRYPITNVHTPSLNVAAPTTTLISTPGVGAAHWPHIDMFADPTQILGSSYPALHEYAISWTEAWNARFYTGDLTSGANSTYSLGSSIYTDIACYTDIQTGDKHAVTVVGCNCFSTDVTDYNLTSGSAATTNLTSYSSTSRIEAMSLYDPNSGDAKWTISQKHWNTGNNNLDLITDIPSLPTITPVYTYTKWTTQTAVAAGVGTSIAALSGNIGNNQYTLAWDIGPAVAGNQDVHSRGVDVTTGSFTTSNVYQMNSTGLNSGLGNNYPVAVSNSSNSGYDLLAAWYNGTDIVYKLTGNSMAFKTNSITNVSKPAFEVFPNPASTNLNVTGAADASYTVTNSLGQVLISGSVNSRDSQVDISSLPAGVYLLNLAENGHLQKIRFTKQ